MALKKVGAIWETTAKSGNPMLSIVLDDEKYMAFPNDKGDNSKRPDWNIVKRVEDEEEAPF